MFQPGTFYRRRGRRRNATTAALLLTVLAGLSTASAVAGATRSLALMRSPVAIAAAALLALCCLATVVVRGIRRPRLLLRASSMMHLGFALVAGGWAFNAALGPAEGYLRLRAGQYGGVGHNGVQYDLPEYLVRLEEFRIDRWPDSGTVRQYTSRVKAGIYDETDQYLKDRSVSVNHPLVLGEWWIYQSSYEELKNPHTGEPLYFTILQCVCDIGLPFVALGGVLLVAGALVGAFFRRKTPAAGTEDFRPAPAAFRVLYALVFLGAVAMLVHRTLSTGHPPMQNMYEFLMCTAAVVPVLTFLDARFGRRNTLAVDAFLVAVVLVPVAFFMDGSVRRLMPALQSPLFVPHVGAYVAGYVLLVRAALGAGKELVGAGFFLLTLGLVLGATWGKVCWGHWWQFDPKEMWSLATWFVYAAYFHMRPTLSEKGERVFLAAGGVMVVLTLTWINMSRLFSGMHSYA